jgi:hypothetical protein
VWSIMLKREGEGECEEERVFEEELMRTCTPAPAPPSSHPTIRPFVHPSICLLPPPSLQIPSRRRQVKGHNGKPTMLSVLVKPAGGAAGQGGAGRGSAASLPWAGAPPLTSGDKQEITERGEGWEGVGGETRACVLAESARERLTSWGLQRGVSAALAHTHTHTHTHTRTHTHTHTHTHAR